LFLFLVPHHAETILWAFRPARQFAGRSSVRGGIRGHAAERGAFGFEVRTTLAYQRAINCGSAGISLSSPNSAKSLADGSSLQRSRRRHLRAAAVPLEFSHSPPERRGSGSGYRPDEYIRKPGRRRRSLRNRVSL